MSKPILAAVLGLSMASICNADIYITGSTAMRSIVYTAMTTPGVVFVGAPAKTLYSGGGNAATYMAFQGTLVGGGATTIQCHWSGSEGGIADVANNPVATEAFIAPGSLNWVDNGAAAPTTITAPVDLAMADNDQQFSRTKTPALNTKAEVGVITFKWVRNPGLWTGNNVTDSMIRQALHGACPRAVFDGNSADANDYVYVAGRDNQSGTRVNAFGDTGFGIFTLPKQIEMTAGVMQQVGGQWIGDFGYSGGGSLAAVLGGNTVGQVDKVNGGAGGYSVIAYLSTGDAATAVGNGAVELTYNGVPFSRAAVLEGQYTFWGNEFILESNNVLAGSPADIAYQNLSAGTGIGAYCDGTKAINLNDMDCSRTGPTSDPSHY